MNTRVPHITVLVDQPHTKCLTHRNYMLTCDEYDALRRAKPGRCHMCGIERWMLIIDHDHALGSWAVRGLVCNSCNQRLKHVDRGIRPRVDDVDRYLVNAWHLSQDTSHKRRGLAPRGACPVCALDCAIRKDGMPYIHWSRLHKGSYKICPGRHDEHQTDESSAP